MSVHLSQFGYKFKLPLILTTAFLDILGIGILIPVFPFLVEWYGMGGGMGRVYTFYLCSLNVYWWFLFWEMVGHLREKKLLLLTSFLTILGYLSVIYSPTFLLFALGRLIAGLGWAGVGVTQAYVSDISTHHNRAKQMWLIWAMFGLGFLIGPAIGWILAQYGIHLVAIGWVVAWILNMILIWLALPEPEKHKHTSNHLEIAKKPALNRIFLLSFFASVAFSPMQWMSSQYYVDAFQFDSTQISHVLIFVGGASILYQGILIWQVRKFFQEKSMIILWAIILWITFFIFTNIQNSYWIWFTLAFFPIWFGSIQPSIASLISNEAKQTSGKYLGINNSWSSLGNIFGPIIAGFLYSRSIHSPFILSSILFFLIAVGVFLFIQDEKEHSPIKA